MVAVLVVAAGGFIGGEVAVTLAARGHTVYGLIRDKKYETRLQQAEVITVLGSADDDKVVVPLLSRVSVIIDALPPVFTAANTVGVSEHLFQLVQQAAQEQHLVKRYINTSGILVYAGTERAQTGIVDESCPQQTGDSLAKGRSVLEQKILNQVSHPLVDGVVVRPGFVYGKSGGNVMVQALFAEKSIINPTPEATWSWVHIVDLAEAYALLTEASGNLVSGQDFDIVDGSTRLTFAEIRKLFTQISGVKLADSVPGDGMFDKFTSCRVIVKGEKIRHTVNWFPRHGPLTDHVLAFYQAINAYKTA